MHLFLSQKEFTHVFYRENDLRVFFVAKMIYALRPESYCALEVAIRKVQTFWASVFHVSDQAPIMPLGAKRNLTILT